VVLLGAFSILPLVLMFVFSLYHWHYGLDPVYVGLAQYKLVLGSSDFYQALGNSLVFAAVVVAANTALGLILALALFRRMVARGLFRALYFLPYVMPVVATSTVWLWIYQPRVGLLDRVLGMLHLPSDIAWVTTPSTALWAVIIFTVWLTLGFTTLLFLAGLTNIPGDLYEAAALDGASRWTVFWRVTWPLLSSTTVFVMIVNTVSVLQSFTQIYSLTGGGPLGSSTTLTYYIYEMAFQYFHFGYATAVGVILFLVVLALTLLQLAATRRFVQYGN
jgi:ABC-type sugar transport system permease subunit